MEIWFVYIIYNKNCSYVGITPDPDKRILKHNGKLPGGAKYTKSKGEGWKYICIIDGLDKINAMKLEWAIKHCPPKKNLGINNRIKKLYTTILKNKWTSKSPDADTMPLIIKWIDPKFRNNDIKLPFYIFEEYLKDNDN
jgi:predicted GIY-YIG superfamily endonuclease